MLQSLWLISTKILGALRVVIARVDVCMLKIPLTCREKRVFSFECVL